MKAKGFKKGDLVRVLSPGGGVRIIRVDRVHQKTLKGDLYEFEKKYKRGDACSYKVKDKNISIEKADAKRIEGQLMQSNLRVKVDGEQIAEVEELNEDRIDTSSRRKKRTSRTPAKTQRTPASVQKFK